MTVLTNPLEIARETLRLLAMRRTPPTPDNYQSLYLEISGGDGGGEIFPEKTLHALAEALPRETPEQLRLARELDEAIRAQDWEAYKARLLNFISGLVDAQRLGWGPLILELTLRLEARHVGVSSTRKRESLEHVLASAGNPELLFNRLQGLMRSWGGSEVRVMPEGEPVVPDSVDSADGQATEAVDLQAELRELVVVTLAAIAKAQAAESPDLAAEAAALATEIRQADDLQGLQAFLARLKNFAFHLEQRAEDQTELRAGLLSLLRLLVENVGDIVSDDRWLHGQLEVLRSIVDLPLSLRTIDEASLRLQDVTFKQSQLKESLEDAKDALKGMLAGFVDQLAQFSDATSGYHDRIGTCAERIASAASIPEISTVLSEVMQETRDMQQNAERSRDELLSVRERVRASDERIVQLEGELQRTSELVRYDQLTGVLNRRGMEEMFDKEVARTRRHASPLCVGMLDIDNFKKLNDSLGHSAGDDALMHLTTLCRETLRPQDTVARYGGEEFVVILPDTGLQEGMAALTRLQRELTRRYFLHDNRKVLITFSAGVTELRPDDSQASVLGRADAAMYQAKQTGKNRVVAAE